jgi:hypothetical protein
VQYNVEDDGGNEKVDEIICHFIVKKYLFFSPAVG